MKKVKLVYHCDRYGYGVQNSKIWFITSRCLLFEHILSSGKKIVEKQKTLSDFYKIQLLCYNWFLVESVSAHTWALADVGKTSIWVQVASFGVESWQLLAVWPNRSSGVYWSDISRKCESGSIDVRQADKMQGTSLFQGHNSFSSLEARFRALRLNSTLQPKWKKGNISISFSISKYLYQQ